MAFLLGDTGKSQISTLKIFDITPATARETLLTSGGILTLPTTEPGTSQVIYTVQSSDLPTILPNVPMKYNAGLVCSGKIGALASVVNYRVLKNGVSVAQAASGSTTAGYFWTHTHWRTFDVVIGDVLEVRYWAAQADVTLDFYALSILPSQPDVSKRGSILKDLNLGNILANPPLAVTHSGVNTTSPHFYPFTVITGAYEWIISSFSCVILSISPNPAYGLFRNDNGDVNSTSNLSSHATQRQVQKQNYPRSISFREVIR